MSISNCTSKNQAKAYIEIYKILKLNSLNVEEMEFLFDLCKKDIKTSFNTSQIRIPELSKTGYTYTNSKKDMVYME